MNTNWWMTALGALEMLSLAVFLSLMVYRGLVGKWPSVVAAFGFELALYSSLYALMLLHVPYRAYFYTYWIGAGVLALFRFWIAADIMKRFPGIDFLPISVNLFIGIAGATMAAASFLYWFQSTPKISEDARGMAVLLNECVNVALAAFSAVFLISIRLLNIGWNVEGARLATGVFVRVCTNLIVAEMLATHNIAVRKAANALDSICCIAILVFWVHYLTTSWPAPRPHWDKLQLKQHYTALLTLLSRER
jgi:hypothetical protein